MLVVAIVSAAGFALTSDGSARVLALLAPLQRSIFAAPPAKFKAIDEMRVRWIRGHLCCSMLAGASFVAVAVAATL